MSNSYERAELLTALWRLGAPHDRMPTSHGILDQALREERSHLPPALGDELTFSVTSVGLRCLELPDILLSAQEAMLTSEPNPTYINTIVTLDEEAARQVVLSHGLSTAEARQMGVRLKQAVNRLGYTLDEAVALQTS